MQYQHTFRVQAPLAAVANFHSYAQSMGAITPPPVVTQLHQAPPHLGEGAEMDFTLWLGPLPVRWIARIEEVSPTGFVDRQLQGPFRRWLHRHTFVPIDETQTEVVDEIEVEPQSHLFWRLIGLGMWLNLPLLFAYRAWKTKRLLEQRA